MYQIKSEAYTMLHVVCLVTKSCLTLCDPTDCSPPGSYAHGISQASILEWVTMLFSSYMWSYLNKAKEKSMCSK